MCANVRFVAVAAVLVMGGGLSGCRRGGEAAESAAATSGPADGHYALRGQIVSVNSERGTLTVDHEAIPDYMPAMAMEFAVSPGDLAIARPGQRIRGEMHQDAAGVFQLERIWPVDEITEATIGAATKALREDTTIRGKGAYREIGENLPDFALYDQDGKVVSGARFRGKKILLNFIYTRCPIATMCPAAVAKMMTVQRLAAEASVKDLELISISFDPEHDTPGVLRAYADARGIDTSNYSFLTGPETAIRDLLTQFGVIAEEMKGPLIQHSLATLLIDERGRIVDRADGTRWEPAKFLNRIVPPPAS